MSSTHLLYLAPHSHLFSVDDFSGFALDAAYAIAVAMGFAFIAVVYAEIMYQHTKHLYLKGKLLRYSPLAEDRDWLQGFLVVFAFVSPCTVLYYMYLQSPAISLRFNPGEIIAGTVAYMFCHDVYFYLAHRYLHINKRLYKALHLMHHEYTTTMNNFAVGWADCIENFIQVGVPWVAWTYVAHGNLWNLLLPLSFTLFTTLIGHSGYRMHSSFVVFHPLIIPIQFLLGPFMLTPSDHGAHHIYRTVNYSLFFRMCDSYFGTYKKNELRAYPYSHWQSLADAGKLTQTGRVRYHAGGTVKERQELKLVELGQTSWGF